MKTKRYSKTRELQLRAEHRRLLSLSHSPIKAEREAALFVLKTRFEKSTSQSAGDPAGK